MLKLYGRDEIGNPAILILRYDNEYAPKLYDVIVSATYEHCNVMAEIRHGPYLSSMGTNLSLEIV